MFTGLVSMMGTVASQAPEGSGRRLNVAAPLFDESIELGESIAVNGVCLTVAEVCNFRATFQLAPETIQRSNLGFLLPQMNVNLERSLRVGDRLGGHWVQGHVDGMGELERRTVDGDWECFHFRIAKGLSKYLVEKGSIAVNGVSLTIVTCDDHSFSVALVPHTLRHTNLGQLGPGDRVNLEVDILAKYVERLLASPLV